MNFYMYHIYTEIVQCCQFVCKIYTNNKNWAIVYIAAIQYGRCKHLAKMNIPFCKGITNILISD